MKKIVYGILAICLVTIGCQHEENTLENLQNKKIPLDSFFEKVIAENVSTKKVDNAFYIDYLWDKENKTIEIINITEKELDFFPISERPLNKENPADSGLIAPGKKYKVTCTKGGKDIWTKECDGKFSCGSLIYDCLEDSGCSTICKNSMIYMPENNEFILMEI
ncbi:hypothetical protein [Flavobacterium microcysteis]|uniref:Lipoprotein n=1 Tax=Flavobacterium microcysteis TaxID=2596891 RepID=A0A501QKQ5_9FLAO|nr:hypothetical protein [Flavobacterium microcysteis]TPD73400.1 hypothetical protein FJA49_01550 [Flavobacterium microcysteis]